MESIGQGAAGSWSLNNLGPRMIKGDFEPGFYIKHFIKDMMIAKDASAKQDRYTPGLDLTLSLYKKLRNWKINGLISLTSNKSISGIFK